MFSLGGTARSSSRQASKGNKKTLDGLDLSNELPPGKKRERKSTGIINNAYAGHDDGKGDDDDDWSKKNPLKKRNNNKKKGAGKKFTGKTAEDDSDLLSIDDESSLEQQTKKQKTTVVSKSGKGAVSKNRHNAGVANWAGPTAKLRKQQEMKRELNLQLGQHFLESANDGDCIDIENYSITQGGVTYHGFQMTDIDESIVELEMLDIMSFKKNGNEISIEEKRDRLLKTLRNGLHFFEHKGRLIGSTNTGTDGNKIVDYGSIEYAFVHELFTPKKVEDIVQDNNEKNPNWQVGKNLLQAGQVPAEEQVIHPMSERRIHSEHVIKEKGRKDRVGYRYYCRCGDCDKTAASGKEGFCCRHFNIHGTKKVKKAAKKKAPAKKKAATKKT